VSSTIDAIGGPINGPIDGPISGPISGAVVAFDGEVGLGEIESTDGVRYPFHCIAIADGSRTIDVGTPVRFGLLGKLGRYEATDITSR